MNKFLPSKTYLLIFSFYLFSIILFGIFRFFYLLSYIQLTSDEPLFVILQAFIIGIRFDQIIILIMLTPLLLILPWVKISSKIVQAITLIYTTLLLSFSSLLLIADIRFYDYYNSRLNFLAVEYINDGETSMNYLTADPRFYLYLFFWALVTIAIFFLIKFIYNKIITSREKFRPVNHIVYFLVFASLFALGIRGRLYLAPLDWGIAYYSDNPFLNQLSLNGIYTLARNLNETNRDPRLSFLDESERFKFVSRIEAVEQTKSIIEPGRSDWPDELSLKRFIQQDERFGFEPNIILIIMESWPSRLTGAQGDKRNLTPNFDKMARDGILFSNIYANGNRTNYGLGAVLCSFPTLPGRSILKRFDAQHPFTTLSEILTVRGYTNYFVHGGDLVFDNMKGFFKEKKFDYFLGQYDFDRKYHFSKWGVPDHHLYTQIIEKIESFERPFQLTALTLSNHEPFDLPDSSVRRYQNADDSSMIFNSQIYADWALGKLIDGFKDKPVFDSTVFVFISDHCKLRYGGMALDPENFHIPLLIYSPLLIDYEQKKIETHGTQVDMIPTLMSLLGEDYEYEGWGKNLFDTTINDFAVICLWNRLGYLDDDFLYYEDVGNELKFYKREGVEFVEVDTLDYLEEYLINRRNLYRYTQSADQLSMPIGFFKDKIIPNSR